LDPSSYRLNGPPALSLRTVERRSCQQTASTGLEMTKSRVNDRSH
jgi:hypothetical protein